MKYFLSIILLCFVMLAQAQEKKLIKAQEQYNRGNYEKTLDLLEAVAKHKETRNNVEVYVLQAKANMALHGEPDFPKALINAMKSIDKAIKKTGNKSFLEADHGDFLDSLRDLSMNEAFSELANKRYTQADKYFAKVFETFQWMPALWGQARVALALEDTLTALYTARELVNAVLNDTNLAPVLNDSGPFKLLVEQHLKKKQYDSAAYYAEFGSDLYPKDTKLTELLLESFLFYITSAPPDISALQSFAHMRPRYSKDSIFLHKENVLFLSLLNQYANSEEPEMADTLLAGFVSVKNQYYLEQGEDYRKKDILYNPNNQELLFGLIRYSAKFERHNLMGVLLKAYVSGEYSDSAFKATTLTTRWRNLFDRVGNEHSVFLLSGTIQAADLALKKESWYPAFRKNLIQNVFTNQSTYKDRTGFYNFIPFALQNYPKDVAIKQNAEKLSLHIIQEYIDSAWFSYAKYSIRQHDKLFTASKTLKDLKYRFTVEDFKANYYGSRLLQKEENGKTISEFSWNGNPLICDEGRVPQAIQQKVEQRINYFRRTAGVQDYVILDTNRNKACQKAALIYEVNPSKRYTEPGETWKCFAYSAVDAAKFGARVMGQTTVFAVNSIMADQGDQNTFVGNRRWLLYPPARRMGHGSTAKTSILWTVDDSGNKDSTLFINDFVAWPPADYCPTMLAFQRWSFSLYADFSKAKVTVTENGKPFPVKQEELKSGYGMPTLVWLPENKPTEGKTYTITIKGIVKQGETKPSTISYNVEFIDPMKN